MVFGRAHVSGPHGHRTCGGGDCGRGHGDPAFVALGLRHTVQLRKPDLHRRQPRPRRLLRRRLRHRVSAGRAWLSRRLPSARRPWTPGLRACRRTFAGAAASAGTVIITGEDFSDVTTLGNDQTFILTTIIPSDAPVFRNYEVQLAPDGHPGPLTQVRLPDAGDLTFSADGSKVAGVVPGRSSTQIMVLTLASGAIRTWSAPGQAANLSWAGSRAIAFMWSPHVSSGPGPAASMRVLDTTAPGHDLQRSRQLIPASAGFGDLRRLSSTSPALSDGAALFAVMTSPRSAPGGPRTAIVEFSARTGQPLRVLSEVHQADSSSYCGVVWADPTGQHVLSSCGSTVSRLDGSTITSWHSSIWDALAPFAS